MLRQHALRCALELFVAQSDAAGKAFVDPGPGNVHVGFNETAGETVIYATFLDVPAGQPATIPADDPSCAV